MTASTPLTNHQVRLAARPVGMPTRANWSFTSEPVPELADGDVLVRTLYLSLDPAMRGWMNEGKSYIAPVGIGDVMRAGGVGIVAASKNPAFTVGDHVNAGLGVQEYCLIPAKAINGSGIFKIDLRLGSATQWLNVLGMPGMTGYFGLMDVGQPKAGETLVVSGAAGAVGQTVGQLAKIKGCRVVGIAGGPAKCAWVVERTRLRRLHRLQGRLGARWAEAALPERRRHLFRQRRRRHPRHRADAHQPQGAHRHLRRDQPVQQHDAGEGPRQLPVAARQPCAHGRHGRVRLRRALPARRSPSWRAT